MATARLCGSGGCRSTACRSSTRASATTASWRSTPKRWTSRTTGSGARTPRSRRRCSTPTPSITTRSPTSSSSPPFSNRRFSRSTAGRRRRRRRGRAAGAAASAATSSPDSATQTRGRLQHSAPRVRPARRAPTPPPRKTSTARTPRRGSACPATRATDKRWCSTTESCAGAPTPARPAPAVLATTSISACLRSRASNPRSPPRGAASTASISSPTIPFRGPTTPPTSPGSGATEPRTRSRTGTPSLGTRAASSCGRTASSLENTFRGSSARFRPRETSCGSSSTRGPPPSALARMRKAPKARRSSVRGDTANSSSASGVGASKQTSSQPPCSRVLHVTSRAI
mmetsp:Transcript_7743/g.25704  ORF Transcript_7743/g.25704 Transcript_7743/m.25704 type:complete len:343 (+) Transcript_7743:2124-3152(+)